MYYPTSKEIEEVKKTYLPGMRVELEKMDDSQAPPIGTQGTVLDVDALGDIIVDWDNGCGLNVVLGTDRVKFIHHMSNQIKDQILEIRETGKTNMFDIITVQRIANNKEYYELVIYLEEYKLEYLNFILTGDPAAGAVKMEKEDGSKGND